MPELLCTARRIGDHESRTEEYEISYSFADGEPQELQVKYQAARAYEINRALDSATETAREAISESETEPASPPTDEQITQLTWRTMQSAKYEEGEPRTSSLKV